MKLDVIQLTQYMHTARIARVFLALAMGAVAVMGFAPTALPLFTMVSLVGFWWLLSTAHDWKASLLEGLAFGLGYFGLGVNWLGISLAIYGGVPFGAAWLMVLLFVAVLASFIALVAAIAAYFRSTTSSLLWGLFFVPSLWVLSEWLRIVTWDGFPWLLIAYSHADTWLAGWSPVGGSLAVSWAVAFSAGLVWWMIRTKNWVQGALVYAIFWGVSGQIGQQTWVTPQGEAKQLALVHGQVSEQVKWDRAALPSLLDAYTQASKPVLGKVALVVWPETAIPTFFDAVKESLSSLTLLAERHQTQVLTGVAIREDGVMGRSYFNSIASLDGSLRYDKRHLVPFSEYYPGFSVLSEIARIIGMPMAQFTAGSDAQVLPLLKDRVALGVCYEADFVQEMARVNSADWWLVVSDDGWFHPSAMAYQHWQMVKLHARVLGREIVRVTNQGVTGVAKTNGEGVVLALPTDPMAAKITQVQPYSGQTPYVRWHDMPLLGVMSFVLGLVFMQHRRAKRNNDIV